MIEKNVKKIFSFEKNFEFLLVNRLCYIKHFYNKNVIYNTITIFCEFNKTNEKLFSEVGKSNFSNNFLF